MRISLLILIIFLTSCSSEQPKPPLPPNMELLPSESTIVIQHRIDNVNSGEQDAWFVLGETYLAHGWHEIAEFCFKEGNKDNHTNARAFFLEALTLDLQGEFKKAIEKYKVASSLDETYSAAHWRMALAYLEIGNADEAIQNAEHAAQLNRRDPNALKALAFILLESGNPRKSAAVLSKYLQNYRKDRYAHLLMGKSLQQLNDPIAQNHLAIGAGSTQVWADPWSSRIVLAGVGPQFERKRALLLLQENKPSEAILLFKSLIKRYPDDDSYKLNLSTALRATGHLDESIELACEVVGRNPNDHLALRQSAAGLFERFKSLKNRDDFLQAIDSLNKAILLTETSEINYILRGHLQKTAGNKQLAAEDFRKAGSIATWMPELTMQSAALYRDLGKHEEAISLLQGLRETYKTDIAAMMLEASIYIELKEKNKALKLISEAMKLAPKNPQLIQLTKEAIALTDD